MVAVLVPSHHFVIKLKLEQNDIDCQLRNAKGNEIKCVNT